MKVESKSIRIKKWKDKNFQANRTNTIIYKLDDIETANQTNLNKNKG